MDKRSQADEQRACDAFNAKHPVGTRILYWAMRMAGDATGACVTIAPAAIWPSGSAMVRIRRDRGGTDYMALTHVAAIPQSGPKSWCFHCWRAVGDEHKSGCDHRGVVTEAQADGDAPTAIDLAHPEAVSP